MTQNQSTGILCNSRQKRPTFCSPTYMALKEEGQDRIGLIIPTAGAVVTRFLALFENGDFEAMKSLFSPTAAYRISGKGGYDLFWGSRRIIIRNLRTIRRSMQGKVSITSQIIKSHRNSAMCSWDLICHSIRGISYQNSGTLKVQIADRVIVAVEETLNLGALKKLMGKFYGDDEVLKNKRSVSGGEQI